MQKHLLAISICKRKCLIHKSGINFNICKKCAMKKLIVAANVRVNKFYDVVGRGSGQKNFGNAVLF